MGRWLGQGEPGTLSEDLERKRSPAATFDQTVLALTMQKAARESGRVRQGVRDESRLLVKIDANAHKIEQAAATCSYDNKRVRSIGGADA